MELQPFIHECLEEFSLPEDEKEALEAEILYQCSVHCVSDVEQLKLVPTEDLETKLQIPLGLQAIMRRKIQPTPHQLVYSIASPAVFTAMSSSPRLQGSREDLEDVTLEEAAEHNPGQYVVQDSKHAHSMHQDRDSISLPILNNQSIYLDQTHLSSYPLLIQSMSQHVFKQRSRNICCLIMIVWCIIIGLFLALFWMLITTGGIALVTLWGTMDFFNLDLFLIVGAVGLGVGFLCVWISLGCMACCCICLKHRETKQANVVKQVAKWYKKHDLIKDFSIRETEDSKAITIKY